MFTIVDRACGCCGSTGIAGAGLGFRISPLGIAGSADSLTGSGAWVGSGAVWVVIGGGTVAGFSRRMSGSVVLGAWPLDTEAVGIAAGADSGWGADSTTVPDPRGTDGDVATKVGAGKGWAAGDGSAAVGTESVADRNPTRGCAPLEEAVICRVVVAPVGWEGGSGTCPVAG